MEIKQQVCSLEIAKKLKELGVKQESIFWYRNYRSLVTGIFEIGFMGEDRLMDGFQYSAFTVAELVAMLQPIAKEGIFIASGDECVADTLAKYLIEHYAQKSETER